MKVTPEFVVSFETEIHAILDDNWARIAANLTWDRFMKIRPSSTKKQILVWLLQTAKLYPEGNGGNTRFDDMVAATTSFEVDNAGAGLKLTKNEIEDNQVIRNGAEFAVLDYAQRWASDIGNAALFYPQQQAFNLIANGTIATSYDGVPFFSVSHPVNPNGGGGTYSNIITGVNLNPTSGTTELDNLMLAQKNFATALATVATSKGLNGVPRYLKPTVMLVPNALAYRAQQLTGTTLLGQSDNILSRRGIEVIVDPLLDTEPTVFYFAVEDMMSNDLGAFVWSEREPFTLRSYSMLDEAALNRRDEFEWTMKGRNGVTYGHPYLFYRCTAA